MTYQQAKELQNTRSVKIKCSDDSLATLHRVPGLGWVNRQGRVISFDEYAYPPNTVRK